MNQNHSARKDDPQSFMRIAQDCVSPFILAIKIIIIIIMKKKKPLTIRLRV